MKYIVSVSGGKDSTACILWALENIKKDKIDFVFMDTKWEHEDTYKYLDYLEDKLNIKIKRIETIGMEELSIKRKCMPNIWMRFCTVELKKKPFNNYVFENYISKGINFIVITGVRQEESRARQKEDMIRLDNVTFTINGKKKKIVFKTLRPIIYWSKERVFEYIKENNIEINPLYRRGFNRVGCYPCVFARNYEIELLEQKYIDRMRKLEDKISKMHGKKATFFEKRRDDILKQRKLELY